MIDMLIATALGVLMIPVFYVVVQRISERKHPFKGDAKTPSADDVDGTVTGERRP